jgi:glucose/arabinose dehydrogenase
VSHGRRIAALAAAASIIGLGALAGGPSAGARGSAFHLRPIGEFEAPDYVAQPPGATNLVYVVEKAGVVRVVKNGEVAPEPFLDLSAEVESLGDDGMSSMTFDPAYENNRRFYVAYTRLGGDVAIDMFRRSAGSEETVDLASRRRIILIHHPDSQNHNGGQIEFGPDGHLYVSMGDGGCCGDPYERAYKLNTLLGKILRIDPKAGGGFRIPPTNPLVGHSGRDEIFAWGFRNPWRFSFDRKAGRLAIGEVGDCCHEEIDYTTLSGARGGNFGWPEYEGFSLVDPGRPGPGEPIAPIFDYDHGARCAVIGGYVVHDPKLASLDGDYVYSDVCDGQLRALDPHLGGATNDRLLGVRVPDPLSSGYRTSSFGEGADGRIFVASFDGWVYRLVASH